MEVLIPIIIALLIMGGVVTRYITGVDDSPPEQIIEEVLETQGIDIDFSPGSDGNSRDV